MGATGKLLVADGNSLLYSAADGSVRVRNISTGAEIILAGITSLQNPDNWQLTGGYVYAEAFGNDCPSQFYCVYQWDQEGVKINLSVLSGTGGNPNKITLSGHDGFLIWNSGWVGVLYNQLTKAFTLLPPGQSAPVNSFYVSNGSVNYYYWYFVLDEPFDWLQAYSWSSQTQLSTAMLDFIPYGVPLQFESPGSIQTDGEKIAWLSGVSITGPHIQSLTWQPVEGGPSSSLAEDVGRDAPFLLSDGVLAVLEEENGASYFQVYLKVVTLAGQIVTLSTDSTVRLIGNASGNVIYQIPTTNTVYRWNAASGTVSELINTIPNQIIMSGTYIYFTQGSNNAVYQIRLQ
ncbi:hypothetical protein [Paraburkholderia megapolitana]|uniref:hypothetical protein n=1 Tax=Paraburkholderia megapolitana TaxID=420953 RepID=UPI0038B73F4D